MGHTHYSKQTSCRDPRLHCENGSCLDPRTHYCHDHDKVLCSSCSVKSHENCKCAQVPVERDVAESLDVTKALIGLAKNNYGKSKENYHFRIFNEELEMFNEMLSMMTEIFAKSIENCKSYEFCSIMEEVSKLQNELIGSSLFAQFSKLKELKQALTEGVLSRQMISDLQRNANESTVISHQKKENNQLEENKLIQTKNATDKINTQRIDSKTKNIHKEAVNCLKQSNGNYEPY